MEFGSQIEFNMAVSHLESLAHSMNLISYHQQTKDLKSWEHELRNLLNKIVDFSEKEHKSFDDKLSEVRKKVRSQDKLRTRSREHMIEKNMIQLENIQRKMYKKMHQYNLIKPRKVSIEAHEKLKHQWGLKHATNNE
jgi:biopolymer transport protein ExbB/TolQ